MDRAQRAQQLDRDGLPLGLLQLSMFSMSESLIFWHPNAFSCTLFTFYAAAALVPAVRQAKSLPVLPPRGRLQPAPAA